MKAIPQELALFGILCLTLAILSPFASAAPPPPKAFVTIVFADGSSTKIPSRNGRFRPIHVQAGETVTVQAQVPPQNVNTPAFAQALDGGAVSEQVAIAADGTASIAFRAGTAPGLYRVLLSARRRTAWLEFIVREEVP